MMRPEVEEALRAAWSAVCVWENEDVPVSDETVALVDAKLRALIELGVRLGLNAAGLHVRDRMVYTDEGDKLMNEINAITVASVLEVEK